MDRRKIGIFLILMLFSFAFVILSDEDYGSSENFRLEWKGITSTGNETATSGEGTPGDTIRSANFVLASSGGQATSVMDGDLWSDGGDYMVFPGFLKVYHDWRNAFAWFEGTVADSLVIGTESFELEWTGIDTTFEDGQGWGIWNYDIEYKVGSGGAWTTWHDDVEFTSATFGPTLPVTTVTGETYYFRVRACDLARNCATDWSDVESLTVMSEVFEVTIQNDFGGGDIGIGYPATVWEPSPVLELIAPGGTIDMVARGSHPFPGALYTFLGWADDMGLSTHHGAAVITSDTTFTAVYQAEYRLQVFNDGSFGDPQPPVGDHWYAGGTEVCVWMNESPYEDSIWVSGATGTGSAPATVFADSFCFIITDSSSITWHWDTLDAAPCTLFVESEYGTPSPDGMVLVECGTEICASVNRTDGGETCTGWLGIGSVPSEGTDTVVCFTITETSHLIWQWGEPRIPFTVYNPGGFDSPVPPAGINWIEYGSELVAYVTSPDGIWECYGYEGTGGVPAYSSHTACTLTVLEPSSITWLWERSSNLIDVTVASDYGDPTPPRGTTRYPIGTTINFEVEDTIYDVSGVTRYVCTGWTGTGSLPAPSGDSSHFEWVVTEDTEIEWQWRIEHLIDFSFSGCGAAIPTITPGDGWYLQDTIIEMSAENPVFDGPDMYAFDRWDPAGLPTIPPGTVLSRAELLVLGPYEIEAVYGPGVEITLRKDPIEDTLGYFIFDGTDTIWSNDTTIWVVSGSEHQIYASETDSTDSVKFVLDRWNVGTSNPITVTPTVTTTYIAEYNKYWFTLISKNPLADIYGSITIDGVTTPGISTTGITWERDLTILEVDLTATDLAPDRCDRYIFTEWSDGYPDSSRSILIDGPTVLEGLYDMQYKFVLRKDPYVAAGDLTIDGLSYPATERVFFWADSGSCFDIELQRTYESGTNYYVFQMWDDTGTSDTSRTWCADATTRCDSLIAVYYELSNVIELVLTQPLPVPGRTWDVIEGEAADSIYWNVGTLDILETRYLHDYDDGRVHIENMSELNIDLGIHITAIETLRPPEVSIESAWATGIYPNDDVFTIQAQFLDEDTPPDLYNVMNDWVRMAGDGSPWATATRFGSYGAGLEPGSGPMATGLGDEAYLFMRFIAPRSSTAYGVERTIRAELLVRTVLE